MMTEEQITGLIEKINNVITQAPEFKNRLKKELFGDVVFNETAVKDNSQDKEIGKKINAITQYLALDNQLDRAESTIDYSWVTDEFTREQLFADFREMLRYRWNCRSHKADFLEFCKFAHFQIEALINYYYRTICHNNLVVIKRHLINNIPFKLDLDSIKTLESISCKTKMIAYNQEAYKNEKFENVSYLLSLRTDIIRNIRNEQSHRDINENSDILDINLYRKELENNGLKFNIYNEVEYAKSDVFIEERKGDDFKEYHKLIYIKNEYFDLVFETLKLFSQNIRTNITRANTR